ncbi:MAG TPA: prolyl oligopeptidase family serine peptidase [Rhizomicrobium sp.]|jgi:prolyl oligopeptidase|nr:prolyl oligopeptidase family serine peptidase [Rhizomicrobium sp.]
MRRAVLALVISLASTTGIAAGGPAPAYPPATRGTVVDHYFGKAVPDAYRWMENSHDTALHKWVDAENALTNSYMTKNPIHHWFAKRLTELWNVPTEATPIPVEGGKIFFERNSGLLNQPVVFVQDSPSAKPRVLIDPNVISPDGSTALSRFIPSPDGKLLAYALAPGGGDWMDYHVLDVASGKPLRDVVRWLKSSGVAWTRDDRGFFYTRYPAPAKGNEINQETVRETVYYHALGTPQSADRLIYGRPDLAYWLIDPTVTENGRYLFVTLSHGSSRDTELYFADMGNPLKPDIAAPLKPLYDKNDAIYWLIDVRNDEAYLQTNLAAPRDRIVAAKLSDPNPAHWRTVVPEGNAVMQYATFAGPYIAVARIVDATSRFELYGTDGKSAGAIHLPELGTIVDLSGTQSSSFLYYNFSSFLYPTSTFRYDLRTGKTETVSEPTTKFDRSNYETKLVFYPSRDGTMVPMFILAAKNVKLDGSRPTMLYGYGGFDGTLTPIYKPAYSAWLELGGVFALSNPRGGDTYGEAWHRAGMLGNKQNVFDDFAWGAKYLIAKGYTSARHIGIQGRSNGGLLVGAEITEHPGLFGAAYAEHGVFDMLRYQRFSDGGLFVPELGSSDDAKAFKWLYAYSPLHNVKDGACYPPTLITTSWDDDRAVPMHSFKFAAALQHAQACSNPILLRTTGATAHSYMPTDQAIAQNADEWAFLGYYLGMTEASIPRTAPATIKGD